MVKGVKIVAPWPLILALFLHQISFLKKTSSKIFDGAFLQISGVAPFVALFSKIVAPSEFKLLTTLTQYSVARGRQILNAQYVVSLKRNM